MADEFAPPSRDDWRALVSAVLAKAGVDGDPEDALSVTTYDGITIKPLYTAEDAPPLPGVPGRPPFVRGARPAAAGWDVRVEHRGPDAKEANAAILDDLQRGATSVWLHAGAGGVPVTELPVALEGVLLDIAPVALDAGADVLAAADALGEHVIGSLGADPIGTRARTGAEADLGILAALAERARPGLCVATVDATVYHDAGASDAQEIGIATAVGVTYLRALTDAGLSVDQALDALEFRLAVSAEQFPSIAKLRAARRVWDRVASLCAASDDRRGQRQHAVTSSAMLTRRDPWVNMLRTTVACFAAAVGGAEAITVAPFDAAIGISDGFARRIARNTHAVLHDESSLARVLDAAGGSWFVESLTESLAQAAWTVFSDIERNGGVLARLDDGTLGRFLAGVAVRRADDIAHRRAPITGVSEFAFLDEPPVTRTAAPSVPEGILPRIRYAQAFEAQRDRADAHLRHTGMRPRVYLLTLGPPAAYRARLEFARGFFQAGGLETVVVHDAEEVSGAKRPETFVVCLCSSEKVYAEQAVATIRALHPPPNPNGSWSGPGIPNFVWMAGPVPDDERRMELDKAGVDYWIFQGCDAVESLRTTLNGLVND